MSLKGSPKAAAKAGQMKSVSKDRVWLVFALLVLGLICCLFGLFSEGEIQYLAPVGLVFVILAIVLQAVLVKCPYCGQSSVFKFHNPFNRTGMCPKCGKHFRIQ